MNQATVWVEEGVEVAPPAWDKPGNRYGSVEGLDDDELASPEELERHALAAEWGPVLLLPKPKNGRYNPAWDWSVDVDYNAFASVDFDRTQPQFDKARYKADRLRERLKDVLIMFAIVSERLPTAKYKVLKYVKQGLVEIEDIRNWDMQQLARLYLRARNLRQEIVQLREASRRSQEQRLRLAAWA